MADNLGLPTLFALKGAWQVLTLFLIPIGGGIPAGVLLAQSKGIAWLPTTFLYLVSDVILACIFEPLILLAAAGSKRSPLLAKMKEAFRKSIEKTTELYGSKLGPLALIGISFGVDPMTGRAVAIAAGHGFVTGWMFAIAGDMLYFGILMVSTLWLHEVLGDGTVTTLIILALMMGVPAVIKRVRGKPNAPLPKESI
ncbi:MAG: hypothetical protein H7301_12195 [Cryobacterium sp.]|nr:hypothetical protein [Oligoflexia bacterium]